MSNDNNQQPATLTKREIFAAMAMQGLISANNLRELERKN
jgi:hypothetical protein